MSINQRAITTSKPAERLALVNGQVVLPDRVAEGMALLVEGARVGPLVDVASLATDIQQVDAGGRYVTAGLVDIHIHGALGYTFNQAAPEAFAAITAECARRGITSLLATIATAPIPDMVECLARVRQWMHGVHPGCQLLGAHVEGPYFSWQQKGAQDPKNMRTPNDGSAEVLLRYCDVIKIMAFAPELPGALELIARLAGLGIVPAAGHSSATDADLLAALQVGLEHVIHLWSGQSTIVREGPWRKPGLLEASLTYPGFTAEMIADNKHLPPTLMKLAYKCLGPDRLCAASDATSGAGLPEGALFRVGEVECDVHDGVGMTLDRTSFAGSTTLINQMLPVLTRVVGVPLAEAVRMVTLTPARVIGVADRKGSLEPGKDADIAIFDEDFTAWRTMVGGRWI
jgi:N-acetylglucosamine-6-phosphate deacetylase